MRRGSCGTARIYRIIAVSGILRRESHSGCSEPDIGRHTHTRSQRIRTCKVEKWVLTKSVALGITCGRLAPSSVMPETTSDDPSSASRRFRSSHDPPRSSASRQRRAAEPGAADNPDDAQRIREDHRVRTSPAGCLSFIVRQGRLSPRHRSTSCATIAAG